MSRVTFRPGFSTRLFSLVTPYLLVLGFTGCASVPSAGDAALAQRLDRALYDRGKGTPAEYATNQVDERNLWRAKELLRGRLRSADPRELAAARALAESLLADIRRGLDWPDKAPETREIPQASGAPEIDGASDEAAWDGALVFKDEYPVNARAARPTGSLWKVMWDQDFFYVAADFPDADQNAVAGTPWKGDGLEIFLCPEVRFPVYWEVIVAPDGTVYDSLNLNDRWGTYVGTPEAQIRGLRHAVKRSDAGYRVEVALPWRELPGYSRGNPPRVGERLSFMLVRCDNGAQSACRPLLYGGHNLFGHLTGTLAPPSQPAAAGALSNPR